MEVGALIGPNSRMVTPLRGSAGVGCKSHGTRKLCQWTKTGVIGNHPATESGKLLMSSHLGDSLAGANSLPTCKSVSWQDTAIWEADHSGSGPIMAHSDIAVSHEGGVIQIAELFTKWPGLTNAKLFRIGSPASRLSTVPEHRSTVGKYLSFKSDGKSGGLADGTSYNRIVMHGIISGL